MPRVQKWLQQHHFLLMILAVAFATRLYGILNTPTDWHAFRQADTASVTREYVKHGIDLLRPTYQDNSNIASGKDNPKGYRMVEFPIINATIAFVILTAAKAGIQLDLVILSRFFSVVSSLATLVGIYWLGKQWFNVTVGRLAATTFALLPYAVYYSRAILPEPFFLTSSVLAIAFFQAYVDKPSLPKFLASAAFLAVALLLKPFALFLAPLFIIITFLKFGWKALLRFELLAYIALALIPMLLWRKWITQFPEGIPVSAWLFNGDKIRFRPAWFRWLGWERLTKLILGFVGMLFLPAVLLVRPWAKLLPLVGWWLSCLIYVSVIATGNVRHDYYQVFLIPVICLSVAVGMFQLWKWLSTKTTMLVSAAILGVLFTIMIRLAWEQVGGYYGTRADWEEAGRAVDKLLPPDAKIIAPAFGDTAFLFQTNRTGWPLGFDIDDKIAKGAQYYVTTAYDDEARELEQKYRVLAKTPAYLIIELTR